MSETKKCPFCAEEILIDAVKCKHCGEMLHERKPEHKNHKKEQSILTKPLGGGSFLIIIGIIVISLGFFHIVPGHLAIFPKSRFSYSLTFVSAEEIVKKYNNRNLGERLRGDDLFDHLVDKLKERGIITDSQRKSIDWDF